jgi:hypothetical protein
VKRLSPWREIFSRFLRPRPLNNSCRPVFVTTSLPCRIKVIDLLHTYQPTSIHPFENQ